MTAREALAKAIGALNIVADVELDPDRDALRITFLGGEVVHVDSEIGEGLAYHFELIQKIIDDSRRVHTPTE